MGSVKFLNQNKIADFSWPSGAVAGDFFGDFGVKTVDTKILCDLVHTPLESTNTTRSWVLLDYSGVRHYTNSDETVTKNKAALATLAQLMLTMVAELAVVPTVLMPLAYRIEALPVGKVTV